MSALRLAVDPRVRPEFAGRGPRNATDALTTPTCAANFTPRLVGDQTLSSSQGCAFACEGAPKSSSACSYQFGAWQALLSKCSTWLLYCAQAAGDVVAGIDLGTSNSVIAVQAVCKPMHKTTRGTPNN